MREALHEARRSLVLNEFPIGAVVVLDDEVIGRGYWAGPPRLVDHAEIVALRDAEKHGLGRAARRRATLYTTLEPCALCIAASMSFLLGRIVFALEAPLDGGTNLPLVWEPQLGITRLPPSTRSRMSPGVLREESIALLSTWAADNPAVAWASFDALS
jgi:tRNA(adenine34) deaminase